MSSIRNSNYKLDKHCKTCGKSITDRNKSGYCDKHRDRTGVNNPFFGKKHSKQTLEKAREKCVQASKKLWTDLQYRQRVIVGTSKPRSELGKKNISNGVKNSYNTVNGLRTLRGNIFKQSWKLGKTPSGVKYHINKSKAELEISSLIAQKFLYLTVSLNYTAKIENDIWYFPDIYIPELKLIIEYNGDYWHANPIKYIESDIINKVKTAKQIWDHDAIKIQRLESKGYIVITIWEYNFRNNKEQTLSNLFSLIEGVISANNQR